MSAGPTHERGGQFQAGPAVPWEDASSIHNTAPDPQCRRPVDRRLPGAGLMSTDTNVTFLRGHQPGGEPEDGLYPLPWSADAAGRILDARGRQVGAMVRPDIASVVTRVLNAAVALNQVDPGAFS